MPNERSVILPMLAVLAVLAVLALPGCATTPADPDILLEADDAIELAKRVGARDYAPLELDKALALRDQAADLIQADEAGEATRLAERAAVQARLAIVRAEGGRARSELERRRQNLDRLRGELREDFGDAIEAGDGS